ncbi:MAG TPA: S8 family serine peptidase [bacterium]|nr:S8 family serine peptidase [bacterium]
MHRKYLLSALLLFAALTGLATPLEAQDAAGTRWIPATLPTPSEAGRFTNIDPRLRNLAAALKKSGAGALLGSTGRWLRTDASGAVQTYLHVTGATEAALRQLRLRGARVEIVDREENIVQAWLPSKRLAEFGALPFVRRITPPSYGVARLAPCASQPGNACVTQGDSILHSAQLRALGFDGTGVKVGVISDGVDSLCNAVGSEELPAGITVFSDCVDPCSCSDGDEGVAMLEIVHDMAPGAELAFGSGLGSTLEFRQRVDDLKNTFGSDVIVDDLGFYLEPYFEDGPVALKVKEAVDAGIIFASAAGNDAEGHYEADYVDSGDGLGSHQIGTGNNVFNVTGFNPAVVLQWSDAFGSAADDYDICLAAESQVDCAASNTQQNGNDDPLEFVDFNCLGGCQIQIRKVSGAAKRIELFVLGGDLSASDTVPEGSVFGHTAVTGVLAAAAIDAADSGHDTAEPYSSQGPSVIAHPSPESRNKPDIAAVDGVLVGGFGGFSTPFFGTSAAAPHVAAVAAQLLGGLAADANEAIGAMTSSAIDLGTPGFDFIFGAGRIDALAAAATFDASEPDSTIDQPASDASVEQGQPLNFAGTCTDADGTAGMTFLWTFETGSGIANKTAEDPGNVVFLAPGTFDVAFRCTDGFGVPDASPDVRIITVTPAPDTDGDGRPDFQDNCVNDANADQKNADHDGAGDACDADDDNDGTADADDNCPLKANADQADEDADGLGDACDDPPAGTTGGETAGDATAGATAGEDTAGATTGDDSDDGGGAPAKGGCSLIRNF